MAVDHARLEALREVRTILRDRRCALVGATALEVRMGLRWRTTYDLDLAVDLDMVELAARLERIPGWQRHGNQRWENANRVPVDLIPAGPEAIAAGELVWPETGARMNLVGLGLPYGLPASGRGARMRLALTGNQESEGGGVANHTNRSSVPSSCSPPG